VLYVLAHVMAAILTIKLLINAPGIYLCTSASNPLASVGGLAFRPIRDPTFIILPSVKTPVVC